MSYSKNQKGLAPLILVAIVAIIVAATGTASYLIRKIYFSPSVVIKNKNISATPQNILVEVAATTSEEGNLSSIFPTTNNAGGVYNCNEHYAYIVENEGVAAQRSKELYYDGVKVDESPVNITWLNLFGDSYAYIKYHSSKGSWESDDVFLNGKLIGKGSGLELWANNVIYHRKDGPGKYTISYNGKDLVSGCESYGYELWGNNYAYTCGLEDVPVTYYNGEKIGVGRIVGIHKNFLLLDKREDQNSDSCYVLYKEGVKVDSFIPGHGADCSGNLPVDLLGVSEDNYWRIKQAGNKGTDVIYDIIYNGKTVYSGINPKRVMFGDNFIYGNYHNTFINSNRINKTNTFLSEDSLFGNHFSGLLDNKFIFDSTVNDIVGVSRDTKIKMFGDNYLVWSGDKIFFNGKLLGPAKFDNMTLLDSNYAYFKPDEKNPSSYYGTLILNGKEIIKNIGSGIDFVLTGKNIYYKMPAPGDSLYYRNDKILGSMLGKADKNKISNLSYWPKMGQDTGIGTEDANRWDIWTNIYGGSENIMDNVDRRKGQTFTDEWLYCTNQWK